MAAPAKNKYWKLRETHGRNLVYKTPDDLLKAVVDYLKWCNTNPWLKNEQLKTPVIKKNENGERVVTSIVQIPTQRPYTLTGMCVHIGITLKTWKVYCKRKGFVHITTHAEEIIETQQFEGAAVGAFNANIIARKLGLSDSNVLKGDKENPIQTETKFDITLNLNK